ncbi:MAG: NUDIX hydrolase [Candidatus Helarchaeota archaeon]
MNKIPNFHDLVVKKLTNRVKKTLNFPGFKKAAVILLYHIIDDIPYIIFEKRQENLRNHSGEISLPGGAIEPDKDKTLLDTVLRETKEEIGIDKSEITIVGELDDMFTLTSHYIISIYVGKIDHFDLNKISINYDEVAEVFEVPVGIFLNKSNFYEKFWTINGKKVPIYHYKYKNYIIWGATGYIINQFIRVIFDYNPSSIKDFHRTDPSLIINWKNKK